MSGASEMCKGRAHAAWCFGWGLLATLACVDAPKDELDVPASAGAVQVASSGDPISEAEACERLKEAYDDAVERLDCSRPELVCPDALRSSAPACSNYPEGEEDGGDWSGGVGECVQLLEGYSECADLDRPCIVPALESRDDACLESLNPPEQDSGTPAAVDLPDASMGTDPLDAGGGSVPDGGVDAG